MPRFGRQYKDAGQPAWFFKPKAEAKRVQGGAFRFTLKGSPRHYDDVRKLIDADPHAHVYFGEALTYERGAGVAMWRVEASGFDWLPKLYDWWAEMERVEPIRFTFHLYFPDDWKNAAMDLREHAPQEVADFIRQHAPRGEAETVAAARRQ